MHFIEKSELSWFSLSESVKRKEREKALFCYRLLSHSIENENFKMQLLGDLYLFLDEKETAYLIYKNLFDKYLKDKDFFGVFSIIDRISSFESEEKENFVLKLKNIEKKTKIQFIK